MKKAIVVSAPRSGLSVGLTSEATEALGGVGTKVQLDYDPITRRVAVYPDPTPGKGGPTVRKNTSAGAAREWVVGWTRSYYPVVDAVGSFAQVHLDWAREGDNAISFVIPPADTLEPGVERRHVGKKAAEALGVHDQLGAALAELNRLMEEPGCADVQIFATRGGQRQVLERPFRLGGKVIVEKVLG